MASGYLSTKTKRKDLDDDIYDDFSDFSLSSPARKIRRLDAEMEPIMEEEEPRKRVPLVFEQQQQQQQQQVGEGGGGGGSFGAVIEELEELSSEAENEERAIVLFNPNPINTPLFLSPSNFSLTLHSDIASGFKTNQFVWTSKNPNTLKSLEEDENEVARQGLTRNNNGCLAVVPWMPTSQIAPTQVTEVPRAEISELMESENDMGAATMDIEEESNAVAEFIGMGEGGIHQWQQQHCMIPQQIPHNTSTPIVWFR